MSVKNGLAELAFPESGKLVVHMPTTLDSVNAGLNKTLCLDAMSAEVSEIVLDMSQTTFMDSAGIGTLVTIYRETKKFECRIVIKQATGQPLSLLKSVQIDKAIDLE